MAAYLSSDDELKTNIPWIDELLDCAHGQTGFGPQRQQARDWLDGLIVHHAPQREKVRDDLAADRLMVSEEVKNCQRWYVIQLISRAQFRQPGDKYDVLAAYAKQEAEQAANTLLAEFDTDDDGEVNYAVDLVSARVWRG